MHQADEVEWDYRIMWIHIYTGEAVLIWDGKYRKYLRDIRQWIYDFGNGYGTSVVKWDTDLDVLYISLSGNKDSDGYPEYTDVENELSVHVDTIDDVMDVVRHTMNRG